MDPPRERIVLRFVSGPPRLRQRAPRAIAMLTVVVFHARRTCVGYIIVVSNREVQDGHTQRARQRVNRNGRVCVRPRLGDGGAGAGGGRCKKVSDGLTDLCREIVCIVCINLVGFATPAPTPATAAAPATARIASPRWFRFRFREGKLPASLFTSRHSLRHRRERFVVLVRTVRTVALFAALVRFRNRPRTVHVVPAALTPGEP
mmetsp:Transcript_13359/g.49997  ORF Transcript_13359/g.49997 Transcript_13359/m.49997 type:complete len:204 (+) Transcript_13359:3870-4481(+)